MRGVAPHLVAKRSLFFFLLLYHDLKAKQSHLPPQTKEAREGGDALLFLCVCAAALNLPPLWRILIKIMLRIRSEEEEAEEEEASEQPLGGKGLPSFSSLPLFQDEREMMNRFTKKKDGKNFSFAIFSPQKK